MLVLYTQLIIKGPVVVAGLSAPGPAEAATPTPSSPVRMTILSATRCAPTARSLASRRQSATCERTNQDKQTHNPRSPPCDTRDENAPVTPRACCCCCWRRRSCSSRPPLTAATPPQAKRPAKSCNPPCRRGPCAPTRASDCTRVSASGLALSRKQKKRTGRPARGWVMSEWASPRPRRPHAEPRESR